ncbi:SPOR domain-containing protein [Roseibium sp. RKSG952]|uniref:SPOR domain-containing protein n=1 Tax=Roseibium sp. RKSG952 TaxID=2529384 RepID=UPI0018AD2F45
MANTDYFAGLDDIVPQPEKQKQENPARTEPAQEPAGAPEPAARPQLADALMQNKKPPYVRAPKPPVQRSAQQEAAVPAAAPQPKPAPQEPLARLIIPKSSDHKVQVDTVLWPEMPAAKQEPEKAAASSQRPESAQPPITRATPQPGVTQAQKPAPKAPEPVAAAPVQTPQAPQEDADLTSGFEDELIGALRQSFDPATEAVMPADAGPEMAQAQVQSPMPEPKHDARQMPMQPVAPVHQPVPAKSAQAVQQPRPAVDRPAGEAQAKDMPVQPVADAPGVPQEHLPGGFDHGVPANDHQPALEDELFEAEAVKAPPAEQAPVPETPKEPDFEALLAELKLPEFQTAQTAHSAQAAPEVPEKTDFHPLPPLGGEGEEAPRAQQDELHPLPPLEPEAADPNDIDNMSWPAAAASVPRNDESDMQPPQEGYDLDAVARAMQESDPILNQPGVLPPHPAAEKAAAPRAEGRSRKGAVAAITVLGIAVLGIGGFYFFDDTIVPAQDGPPPVIAGLDGPLKVFPEKQEASDDSQGSKLIYDRVGGVSDPSRERLVLPETTQPAELPPAPENMTGTDQLVPGSPKKVRTLVVRPDGTIVTGGDETVQVGSNRTIRTPERTEEPAVAAASALPGAADGVSGANPATAGAASEQTAEAPSEAARAVTPEPVVSQPNLSETPVAAATPSTTGAAVTGQPEASEAQATEAAPAAVPSVTPRLKPAAPVRVASAPQTAAPAAANTSGPLDLTASAPSSATAATAAPAASAPAGQIAPGTYVVQVTSQRSAKAAQDAYIGLQQRFPSVLGNRNAVIVSADLGERGTFYRARIPAGSRNEAITLCENLKAAGGDCFVRQN